MNKSVTTYLLIALLALVVAKIFGAELSWLIVAAPIWVAIGYWIGAILISWIMKRMIGNLD